MAVELVVLEPEVALEGLPVEALLVFDVLVEGVPMLGEEALPAEGVPSERPDPPFPEVVPPMSGVTPSEPLGPEGSSVLGVFVVPAVPVVEPDPAVFPVFPALV